MSQNLTDEAGAFRDKELESSSMEPATSSPLRGDRDRQRRSPVHIIWEVESCPIPGSSTAVATVQALSRLAGRYGQLSSFGCICRQGHLPPHVKRDLQDFNVVVEEVFSDQGGDGVHVFAITQIMQIALQAAKPATPQKGSTPSAESSKNSSPGSESGVADITTLEPKANSTAPEKGRAPSTSSPTLILLTNNRHYARALGVLRRSGLFAAVVLLHSKDAPEILIRSANIAQEWFSLLGVTEEKETPAGLSAPSILVHSRSSPSLEDASEQAPTQPSSPPQPPQPQPPPSQTSQSPQSSRSSLWTQPEFSRPIASYPSIIDDAQLLQNVSTTWSTQQPAPNSPPQPTTPNTDESVFSLQAMSEQAANFARRTALEREVIHRQGDRSSTYTQPTPSSEAPADSGSRELREFRSFLSRTLEKYKAEEPHQFAPVRSPSPGMASNDLKARNLYSSVVAKAKAQSPPPSAGSTGSWGSPTIEPLALPGPADGRSSFAQAKSSNIWPSESKRIGTSYSPQNSPPLKPLSGPQPGPPGPPMSTPAAIMSARRRKRRNFKGRMSKLQRNAIALFDQVMDECMEEKIIPRESVVRSRIEPHLLPKARKLKSGLKVPLRFEHWVNIITEASVCNIEGLKPQRVIWPVEGRFECADYFRPVERLTTEETQQLVDFFEEDRPQVDRGRYGLATYLKYRGPSFVRKLPRGYIVELVQLLLNKHILVFRKGKVSYAPMGVSPAGLSSPDGLVSNGASEGPPLPKAIRQALGRHLSANNEFAGQVTDDPVGVLHFLCFQSCPTDARPGARLRRVPVYHFEKSGLLHAPMWVCVVTLEAAGLRDCKVSQPTQTSQKFKRFRSSQKGRKGESQQEVALHVLENYYWKLAFNVCLADIPHEAKMRTARMSLASDDTEREGGGISDQDELDVNPTSLYACFQPGALRPAQPDSRVALEETKEREAMVKAALRRSALRDIRQQDSVLRLDRLVFAMDQKPVVYEVSHPGAKDEAEGVEHPTTFAPPSPLWTYSVELQLRPRSAVLSSGTPPPETKQLVPSRSTPTPSASSPPSPARYPPIEASATTDKKSHAKSEVAGHILQKIRIYQVKYPQLFQLGPPSSTPSGRTASLSPPPSRSSISSAPLIPAMSPPLGFSPLSSPGLSGYQGAIPKATRLNFRNDRSASDPQQSSGLPHTPPPTRARAGSTPSRSQISQSSPVVGPSSWSRFR